MSKITKGISHVSVLFLTSLTGHSFAQDGDIATSLEDTSRHKEVSYAWLVRTSHLFNGATRWLEVNKSINYDSVLMQEDFAKSGEISKGHFLNSTGKLTSYKGLMFLTQRVQGLTTSDVKAIYYDLSTALREWDNWFHSGWSSRIEQLGDALVTGNSADRARKIWYDDPKYVLGSVPKDVKITGHDGAKSGYIVINLVEGSNLALTYGAKEDEVYQWFKSIKSEATAPIPPKEKTAIVGDINALDKGKGAYTIEQLEQYNAAVFGPSSAAKYESKPLDMSTAPLTAEAVGKMSESEKTLLIVKGNGNTPILDWLTRSWAQDGAAN